MLSNRSHSSYQRTDAEVTSIGRLNSVYYATHWCSAQWNTLSSPTLLLAPSLSLARNTAVLLSARVWRLEPIQPLWKSRSGWKDLSPTSCNYTYDMLLCPLAMLAIYTTGRHTKKDSKHIAQALFRWKHWYNLLSFQHFVVIICNYTHNFRSFY